MSRTRYKNDPSAQWCYEGSGVNAEKEQSTLAESERGQCPHDKVAGWADRCQRLPSVTPSTVQFVEIKNNARPAVLSIVNSKIELLNVKARNNVDLSGGAIAAQQQLKNHDREF
ncbi:hypothetical protein BSKO_06744 [Bryopsis sp. KO-2023]|nr:hypothetical protein BSKO_06744 [Bryopsis sp. KO-2023]